jgi:hypothetical protein
MPWLVIFLLCTAYEGYCWLTGKMMATQAIVKYIPAWITIPVLLWLFGHFVCRYYDADYLRWLDSK